MTPRREVFADLTGDQFLDAAEKWIVDRWGVTGETWRWDKEARRLRFGEGSGTSHSHGEMPTKERYHTHLEWNAMWCAAGDLMATRALAKKDPKDDWRSFERWVERWTLTMPPLWLSDLRGPKPIEEQHWFAPDGKIDAWLEDVGDSDFMDAIKPTADAGLLVVGGHWDTHSSGFFRSTRVVTALVSSPTASALVRALQTVGSSWDYGLPASEDDRLEIDDDPYRLKGWLSGRSGDSHFDRQDPFRYEVHAIDMQPSGVERGVEN